MGKTAKPGERIAKFIHEGTSVLLPGNLPGTHEGPYYAACAPYEENGEWWVNVTERCGDYSDTFPIALWEASLPA